LEHDQGENRKREREREGKVEKEKWRTSHWMRFFWKQQGEPRVEDGARRGKHRRMIGVPWIGLIPIRTTTISGKEEDDELVP
jgi:hypothetical protein